MQPSAVDDRVTIERHLMHQRKWEPKKWQNGATDGGSKTIKCYTGDLNKQCS